MIPLIYVKINGEKWEVRGSGLHIRYVDISNINEIEGLQNIENLKDALSDKSLTKNKIVKCTGISIKTIDRIIRSNPDIFNVIKPEKKGRGHEIIISLRNGTENPV